MKIIVGLGNPGDRYKNTRHNTGFLAIDRLKNQILSTNLETQNNIKYSKFKFQKKFQAEILSLTLQNDKHDEEVLLVKPQTFMNDSGLAVKKIIQFNNLTIKQFNNLYILHDDLDIQLGEYRIQFGRSAAGHHGVESIIEQLGTKDFWRVRIGTTTEQFKSLRVKGLEPTDFVLQPFSQAEKSKLDSVLEEVAKELLHVA